MVTISRSALVEYSAQQMFDLINDVESYPEFMTGCLAAELIEKTDVILEARLTLGKSTFQQSFVIKNFFCYLFSYNFIFVINNKI